MLEDINTGTLIDGARPMPSARRGWASPVMRDILLEEALGKAAFKAREMMDRFRLPEGTVLNTTVVGAGNSLDLDALMNIGARQGLRIGMEMVITRGRELVGRLRVTSVDSDVSSGRVVQTTRVRAGRPCPRHLQLLGLPALPQPAPRHGHGAKPDVKLASAALPGDKSDDAKIAKAARGGQFVPFRAPNDARGASADPPCRRRLRWWWMSPTWTGRPPSGTALPA